MRFPRPKKSKYGNVKTVVDGKTFDSRVEAERYVYLTWLQRAGDIISLQCQVPFVCAVYRADIHEKDIDQCVIGKYIVDFQYWDKKKKEWVYEDVKGGMTTALFRWKKKHIEAQYHLRICEVRKSKKGWEIT